MGFRTLALLGLLVFGTTGRAAADPWIFRLEGGAADYSSQTFSSSLSGYTELSLDGGHGYGVASEYRLSPHTGVELSLSSIDLDASWRRVEIRPVSFNPTVLREFTVASDSGTFSLRPLAVTFLIHPLRQGRLDFYVGPQLSWVDFHVGLDGLPDRDPELGIGGKLGFELAIARSPWSAGVVYRYLETQHDGVERDIYTGIGVHLISGVFSYRGRRAGT